MSERPTPETDALAEKLIPIAEKITEFNAQSIIKQLLTEILTKTTKLERERDEARKEFLIANDKMVEAECSVRGIASVMEKVQRERDEARAVAAELASAASHCLGWHDHESTDAAIRITAALKRWKKSK